MSEEPSIYLVDRPDIDLDDPLHTPREQAFIAAYVECLNATQAAIEAGYSSHSARQIGTQTLSKTSIRTAIQRRLAERHLSRDEVLARLERLSDASLGTFVGSDGTIDLSSEQAKAFMDVLQEISTDQEGRIKIKAYSKLEALRTIAKIHGMLIDHTRSENITLHLTPEDLHAAQERISAFNASMGIPTTDTPDNV